MLNRSKFLSSLGFFSFLSFTGSVFAAEISVSKEEWLKAFRALAPEAICQGILNGEKTGALLKESKIDLQKCKPLITQSLNRCLDKYSAEMPTNIAESESKGLGEKLGRCSGEDFYIHYISKSS